LAGRYRVIERIGSGGTGEVYRAHDEQTQSSVAVKLLRPGAAHDLEQATQLFEGAWTASLIRHPNIVAIHETGLCAHGPFIVMEDLRGENVGRVLERHGRLDAAHALALIEPVLLALGAAHGVGLTHGDVKPENVVVCQAARQGATVKLLDFGTGITDNTKRHFVGTTEYLSPEQASLKPADSRSDLFSACVLLYELLTNTRPFHGPTASSTTYRIINLPCPSLAESGLPHHDALWNVLHRGLEKAPTERYQNCRELLEALRPLMCGRTPANLLLGELLPPLLMLGESGSMPVASGVIRRSAAPSSPGPESDSRMTASTRAAPRPSSMRPDSSRRDSMQPTGARGFDSLAPLMPNRHRGRYKVRAIVWQALDAYLRARRPPSLHERLLTDISSDEARDLFLGTLQGIVYCPLELVTLYVELATERLFDGELGWCQAAGREAVDGVLSMALSRSIPPTLSLLVSARRVCQVMASLFDFGTWRVAQGTDPKRVTVTIGQMDPLCVGLRLFFVGLVERAINIVHGNCTVTILRGDGPFMPRLILEVALQ
jgi:serine/threonine-protein kinase